MKPVTTGPGVSGAFADTLQKLIKTLRTATGDARWRLHIQLLQTPEYLLRIYAPDLHSELHTVRMTLNTAKDIREILVREAKSWEVRSDRVLTPTNGNGDRKIE
jgi:hypothetical protein